MREIFRMIENLRERLAEVERAGPVQIAQGEARLGLGERGVAGGRTAPSGSLQSRLSKMSRSIQRPEVRVEVFGKIALPPEIERQIGVEIAEDDVRSGGP